MENVHSGSVSALEQAVVSKNKEFLYAFLSLQEESREKMVKALPDSIVIPLLEVLTELFERKEMRYEVILAIRSVLSWRRNTFKGIELAVVSKNEKGEDFTPQREEQNALRRVLIAVNKEKVDLNKIYELKGRIAFVRDAIEDRRVEKENVPVCREQ